MQERHFPKTKVNIIIKDAFTILGLAFLFLLAIEIMVFSFDALGNDMAEEIIYATSNPFVGLFIGLLATAIIQSSSTITTMVVAIVASSRLPIESAIPVIMGANIGTTVTCAIVSLGHFTKRLEFKKAIATAALHNFFNIIIVAVLFPLELATGFISSSSRITAKWVSDSGIGVPKSMSDGFGFIDIIHFIEPFANKFPLFVMLLALISLFISIKLFTNKLQAILIGKAQIRLEKLLFDGAFKSLGAGFLLTSIVQSSSLTTSLIVPLVAAGKASLKNIFPFIMGANVGTTVTAIIAAISKTEAAISIAMAHFLINILGILILFPLPAIRKFPLNMARRLGQATAQNRLVGFTYVLVTFFLFPFVLIYFSNNSETLAKKNPQGQVEMLKEPKQKGT